MVISQDPAGGTAVHRGAEVTIAVSKGPKEFPMPDVKGTSDDAATSRLEGMRLEVNVVTIPGTDGDQVVGQQPAPGKTVKQGQEVTLYAAD